MTLLVFLRLFNHLNNVNDSYTTLGLVFHKQRHLASKNKTHLLAFFFVDDVVFSVVDFQQFDWIYWIEIVLPNDEFRHYDRRYFPEVRELKLSWMNLLQDCKRKLCEIGDHFRHVNNKKLLFQYDLACLESISDKKANKLAEL